jgi:hypothetical protein
MITFYIFFNNIYYNYYSIKSYISSFEINKDNQDLNTFKLFMHAIIGFMKWL